LAKNLVEHFETELQQEITEILRFQRKSNENWTPESVQEQTSAFCGFGLVKETALLKLLDLLCDEEDAPKNF
jgi:hypothetical protein